MLLVLLFTLLHISDRPVPDVRPAIQAYLSQGPGKTVFVWTDLEQRHLNALYASAGYEPLWIDTRGRVSRCADEALALLRRTMFQRAKIERLADEKDIFQPLKDIPEFESIRQALDGKSATTGRTPTPPGD